MELSHLDCSKFTLEEVKLVDEAVRESAITRAFADRNFLAATVSADLLAELVSDDLRRGDLSVEEDAASLGAALSVVRYRDVHPTVSFDRFFRADANRVARPKVN